MRLRTSSPGARSLGIALVVLVAFGSVPGRADPLTPPVEAAPAPEYAEATDEYAPPAEPASPEEAPVPDDDPRALDQFRPHLDPYGTWADDPTYGRIWIPHRAVVGEGFSPYVSSGHWALDDAGAWIWVSDYPFGGVVFHYGRWVWTSFGWAWIPGARYAPAWVVWRVPSGAYDYVGWSPAPPAFIWTGGIAVMIGAPAPYYWVFCPSTFVFTSYPRAYVVRNPVYVRTLVRHTRRYAPASARIVAGPSLAAARVPASARPATRLRAPATRLDGGRTLRRVPDRATPRRDDPDGRSAPRPRADAPDRVAPRPVAPPPDRAAPRPRVAPADRSPREPRVAPADPGAPRPRVAPVDRAPREPRVAPRYGAGPGAPRFTPPEQTAPRPRTAPPPARRRDR